MRPHVHQRSTCLPEIRNHGQLSRLLLTTGIGYEHCIAPFLDWKSEITAIDKGVAGLQRGLVARPPRSPSNYRLYPPDTVRRVQFIKRAQQLGFSLKEIKEILSTMGLGLGMKFDNWPAMVDRWKQQQSAS